MQSSSRKIRPHASNFFRTAILTPALFGPRLVSLFQNFNLRETVSISTEPYPKTDWIMSALIADRVAGRWTEYGLRHWRVTPSTRPTSVLRPDVIRNS